MIFLKKFLLQSTRSFHIIHFIFIIFFFLSGCSSGKENQKRKMILSFYLDDTSPAIASPEALKTFLDYCKANGVKGESTVVLGYDGESMAYNPDSLESQFLKYASGSYEY
jgi:hypothetical protein